MSVGFMDRIPSSGILDTLYVTGIHSALCCPMAQLCAALDTGSKGRRNAFHFEKQCIGPNMTPKHPFSK